MTRDRFAGLYPDGPDAEHGESGVPGCAAKLLFNSALAVQKSCQITKRSCRNSRKSCQNSRKSCRNSPKSCTLFRKSQKTEDRGTTSPLLLNFSQSGRCLTPARHTAKKVVESGAEVVEKHSKVVEFTPEVVENAF